MTASHSSTDMFGEHPVAQEAGVVDEHVEPAERVDARSATSRCGAVPVGDVVGVGDRLAAGRADLVDDLLRGRRPTSPRPRATCRCR